MPVADAPSWNILQAQRAAIVHTATPNLVNDARAGRLERVLAILLFALLFRSADQLLAGGWGTEAIRTVGGVLGTLAWPTAYVILGRWGLYNLKLILSTLSKSPALLLVVAVSLLSVTWSLNPSLTLEGAISLFTTTLVSIYFSTRYSREELFQLLSLAIIVMLGANLAAIFLFPQYSVDFHGNWVGLSAHKNRLGAIVAVAVLLWSARFVYAHGSRWLSIIVVLLGLWMLTKINSQTSLLLTLVSLVAVLILPLLPRFGSALLGPMLIAAGILFVPLVNQVPNRLDSVVDQFGRDTTLTGRTDLWAAVWEKIIQKPFLGYGYDAFWPEVRNLYSTISLPLDGFIPFNSHNGYLDLALHFGLLGFAPVLFFLVTAMKRATGGFHANPSGSSLFFLVCLMFILIYNMLESNLLEAHSIWWVLIVCTVLYGSRTHIHGSQQSPDVVQVNTSTSQSLQTIGR